MQLERRRPDLAGDARERAIHQRAAAFGAASDAEGEALEAVYVYGEVMVKKNGREPLERGR